MLRVLCSCCSLPMNNGAIAPSTAFAGSMSYPVTTDSSHDCDVSYLLSRLGLRSGDSSLGPPSHRMVNVQPDSG